MRKKIWTAEEELKNVMWMAAFCIFWYGLLLHSIIRTGFHTSYIIFLLAGMLAVVQTVRIAGKAFKMRRFHRQCVQEGRPEQGRIVNVTREYRNDYSGERPRRYTYYYLIVEVVSAQTGLTYTVKSDAYRIPVHKYLRSPNVQVYTDSDGCKKVIDGFLLKERRSDPDISIENPNINLKSSPHTGTLERILAVIILIFILLRMFGIIH